MTQESNTIFKLTKRLSRMSSKNLFVFTALCICFSFDIQAQKVKYSNEFLAIGVGSAALAQGNAVASNIGDVTAAFWNPAGLVHQKTNVEAAFMHSEYFAGIAKYDYGAISKKIDTSSVAAFSVIRFGVDDIPNTTDLINQNGQIDYNRITSFSAADYAFLASYARKLKNTGLSVGANLKVVHRIIGNFANSWGFGLDAGMQYRKGNLMAGVMIRDISTTFNAWAFSLDDRTKEVFLQTGNELPQNGLEITLPRIVPGISYLFTYKKISARPALDLHVTTDGYRNTFIKSKTLSIDPCIGLELGYQNLIYVRGGINNIQEIKESANVTSQIVQPNFGVGVKIMALTLDYALTNVGQQAGLLSHVFTVRLGINPKPAKVEN